MCLIERCHHHSLQGTILITVMYHLIGVHSEKCIVRQSYTLQRVRTQIQTAQPTAHLGYTVYSPSLLSYKPVQHVTVPNTSGSYKIVVCVCVSKQKKYSKNMVLQTYGTTVQTLCSLLLTKMLNGTMLYSVMWPYHIFFMHSSVHGHMGYFYFWAIMNNGSMNMHVQVFGWTQLYICLRYIMSGTTGSYDNSIKQKKLKFTFNSSSEGH